jgi:SAM-dependent methyltransferase
MSRHHGIPEGEVEREKSIGPAAPRVPSDPVNWSDELEEFHEESSRDHPIEVLTREVMVSRFEAIPDGGTLVDVGCSTGYLLSDLQIRFPSARVVGFDLILSGLRKALHTAPRTLPVLADACLLPLGSGSVDGVVSANLLEHVRDDVGALAEIYRVLRPGSLAALVVPAGPGVYDYYDRFLHHERRYGRRELADKSESVGFDVLEDTHLGVLPYPAFWAVKKKNRVLFDDLAGRELEMRVRRDYEGTQSSRVFELACRIERRILNRGTPMPFGIRGFTLVRKPCSFR